MITWRNLIPGLFFLLNATWYQSRYNQLLKFANRQTSPGNSSIFLTTRGLLPLMRECSQMYQTLIQRSLKTNMKHFLSIIVIILLIATSAHAADVGVSVSVGQPGFFGRIDIGSVPHPEIIYPEPVVIRPHAGIAEQPVYLHVPPGHEKKWRKHCRKYNACGRPVYFVRDRWYNDVYVKHHRESGKHDVRGKGEKRGGKGHKGDKSRGHGHDRG